MIEPWPPSPSNLRLVLHSGQEIPIECVYDGIDDDGITMWTVVVPAAFPREQVAAIRADVWPGRCGVSFPVEE